MRKAMLLFNLVVVLILCVALVGCANTFSKEDPAGQQAAQNSEWLDPDNPADQEWPDPDNPENQEWLDPDNPADQEWPDPDNPRDQEWIDEPSDTPTENSDYDPATGQYRHEVCGVVFYTEHDINQWIHGDTFDFLGMCAEFGLTRGFLISGSRATTPVYTDAEIDAGAIRRDVSFTDSTGSNPVQRFNTIEFEYAVGGEGEGFGAKSNAVLFAESSRYLTIAGEDNSADAPIELIELSLWGLEQLDANPNQDNVFGQLGFYPGDIYAYN